MYDFSVPMALVDYIPVLFFGIAAAILQLDLYGKMRKDAFALFAAGTINIFAAGLLKATWKLLYAAGICDFQALNTLFLPLQSMGFLLAGVGIILMLWARKPALLAVAPPVFSGSMVFVAMMVLGLGSICTVLSILAVKLQKKSAVALFVLSFLCSMGMGYMSSRDSHSAAVNWIEQGINCAGQGLLLWGTLVLHKSGLKELKL
ncbi:MAG: hypothetical protein IKW07_06615 [Clostridia bacterium]|jgi:hypothetical protein|nr:hypothetical protein [Clostridia bacterium]